jgi:hypothetical protein
VGEFQASGFLFKDTVEVNALDDPDGRWSNVTLHLPRQQWGYQCHLPLCATRAQLRVLWGTAPPRPGCWASLARWCAKLATVSFCLAFSAAAAGPFALRNPDQGRAEMQHCQDIRQADCCYIHTCRPTFHQSINCALASMQIAAAWRIPSFVVQGEAASPYMINLSVASCC